MRDLPRSAALAAWGSAVLTGAASIDDAVSAVQADDLTHDVDLSAVPLEAPVPGLVGLLAGLRRSGVTRLRLHLPAEGDLGGLPGPARFNLAALEALECVVTEDGPACGFVPVVEHHGRPDALEGSADAHTSVRWQAFATQPGPQAQGYQDLRECRQSLLTTLARASDTLERLDTVNWAADPEPGLDRLRTRSVSAGMPPGTPARAAQVLDLAWRVREVVALARRDDGGAVSTWEAEQRLHTLRSLDGVSRHALVAAINAALEPAH